MKDGKLEVKDLMVGDWLSLDGYNDSHVKVVGIDSKDSVRVEIINENEPYEGVVSIEYAKPIQLTPEILRANGFNGKDDDELEITIGDHYVIYSRNYMPTISIGKIDKVYLDEEEVDYESTIYFVKTPYVHEFQNVLRICGMAEISNSFQV